MQKRIIGIAAVLLLLVNNSAVYGATDLEDVNNFDVHYFLAHQYNAG